MSRRDPLIGFSAKDLRDVPRRDLAVRFAFGAAVSLVAGLIGTLVGTRLSGVFLAFPAILPATLPLIEEEESLRKAEDDDVGAVLGAVALFAFAGVAWWLFDTAGAAVALTVATVAWLGTAVALYLGLRASSRRRSS